MNRFNYLGDSIPTLVERARSVRVPERLRTPFSMLGTSALLVVAWWGLAQYWLSSASLEEQHAQVRLTRSRAALAQARIERVGTEKLETLDRALRSIRLSGSMLGVRLADLANHVPDNSWLTSLSDRDGMVTIDGRSEGIVPLGKTLTQMLAMASVSDPSLVRAARESRAGIPELISFEVRATVRAK